MTAILITGATGAIGGQLARDYAAPGVTLNLHGRQQAVLQSLADECRARGAEVFVYSFDLTDTDRVMVWVDEIEARQPIDLIIASAGMNTNIGEKGEGESWHNVSTLIDLNLKSVMALVHAAIPHMRRRRSGQIALFSSLAGYFGLPVTPAYSASKAAIKAYSESLRGWLGPEGVRINLIMPGYVDSQMCREMPGPKPFLWMPDKASRVIRKGLQRDKVRITFPFPLNIGCWALTLCRPADAIRILRWLDYRG